MRRRAVSGVPGFLLFLLRWLVVAAFLGVAAYAGLTLRGPDTETRGGILGAIPHDLPAIQAQRDSVELFGVPLLTRILVVSSYEGERSVVEQGELAAGILAIVDRFNQDEPGFVAALPVPEGVWPHNTDNGETVVVTYLFFDTTLSISQQLETAGRFRDALQTETGARFAGVTGALKASDEQSSIVDAHVHWIEGATLVLVFAIVALRFGSLFAPLVALLAGGLAYIASMTLLDAVQEPLSLSLSSEVRPLLVVLIFGIVTDYSIFYLGSFRRALADADISSRRAAWQTWLNVTPIVTVAAVVVAVGGLALFLAEIHLVRSMAPAIALAVALGYAASVTFTPLLLASLGTLTFWPQNPRIARAPTGLRGWSERQIVKRWVAVPVLVILGLGLTFAAIQARDAQMATTLIRDLPDHNEAARAERIASRSIPAGAVAPTVLIVNGTTTDQGLGLLEERVAGSPGVAAVVGPRVDPSVLDVGVLKAPSGTAVRFLIIFDSDPYGAPAIDDYQALVDRMPAYLSEAGMTDARARFAGDTAVSAQVSAIAFDDLIWVGGAVIVLELIVLLVFLRSLMAPPLLLIIATLLVMASLGLTATLSGMFLGHESLSFLVPIATMVLLLSLGADYNLFLIGQVWSAQRRQPFPLALRHAATETSSTILTAGLALTASFAILAIVPLASFRQIALAMSIGLLADTLVIRPLLVPALLASLRRLATWPAPHFEDDQPGEEAPVGTSR
jgi:RND superfamily putative drug exporter